MPLRMVELVVPEESMAELPEIRQKLTVLGAWHEPLPEPEADQSDHRKGNQPAPDDKQDDSDRIVVAELVQKLTEWARRMIRLATVVRLGLLAALVVLILYLS